MAIYINEDDAKLFQQNGFSYDDVNDTVEHYRESGIKDDEIQKKIDARITQFKNAANNNTSNAMFNQEALGLDKVKPSEIYATPKSNALTDFLNCLQWVKNTSVSAWGEGLNQAEIANLEAKDMFHTINTQEKNRLEELENAPAKQYEKDYKIIENRFADKNADTFIADLPNNTKKAYIEAVKMLPYMWETIKAGGIGGAGGAILGAGAGLATGLLTTKANTPQLVAQGARTGLSIGSRITGAGKIAELEGGLARSELKQINKEIIQNGGESLSEAELDALAIGVGTINAGLEVIGLKQVLKTIPNGDKILQYIEKKQLRELVSDATVRGQLKNALKQYGKAIGTEVSTEIAQEATNIAADHLAQKLGNIDFENQDFSKDLSRLVDTGKATFGAMVFIGGFGTAAKATSIMVKQGLTKEEAEAKTAEMTPEEQQDFVEENFDTLMEIAKDVDIDEREKVVSQLSEKFQQEGNLLKDKTLANGTAELFTRGLEVVSEANGIPLETLMQNAMPKVVDEAGIENAPEVEEKRVINDRLGEIEQEFNNLAEEDFENGKFDELEAEYEKLTDLKNQGEAYYQEANTAGAEGGEYLDAAKEWEENGTDSKYFKKWFGNSKVVDEEGKPLKVYHGSLWKFDTFGKSEEFDFSLSPKFAYEYAAQKSFEQALDLSPVLYSAYLKIENPFDFRNEESVNELLDKIGDEEINFWGNIYTKEQFKDYIMGLSYENTVPQKDFDKAEIGMAYSRYNENVEEKMSSVADARIVYKNNDYFIALDEIDEPRRSPFSSEPAGRVDRDDVYKQVEALAKDVDFGDEYKKKLTLNTNLVKTTYELGKGYVDEYTPYELTVTLRKIDNPKLAKKGSGYDNWSFLESTKIGDTYFVDFLKNNGYDGYYKQEKEQLNISVFNPEQIKSVDNRGTFDANNPNIYYQAEEAPVMITPVNIEAGSVPNKTKVSDLKKWIFENLSLLGDVTIKENGRTVYVGKGGIDRSLKGISRDEAKRESYSKLRDIIENAIEYKPKETDKRHPNVSGQEIYHNAITFNGKTYGIEISVDIPKIKNAPYNYAGHKIKEIKIEPAVSGVASDEVLPDNTGSNISITDIRRLFNPTKYNQFAGENAKTADKYSLKEAQKRLKNGEDAETVRKETGWFKGTDGKFRFEISDKEAEVDAGKIKEARQKEIDWINTQINAYNLRMSDLVKKHDNKEIPDNEFKEQYDSLMNRKLEEVQNLRYYENKMYSAYLPLILKHDKLFAAYPSLRVLRVEFKPMSYNALGSYSESQNTINLDINYLYKKDGLKQTLMHEIQHFIQHKEGFAIGGNTNGIEIILADAKNEIENSADSREYDFAMKKYSIVNNLLLIRAIQKNPERITKSYWYMQQGKGWYAPRKTRKNERRKYINDCCQEFMDYSIKRHKENNTFEAYKRYSSWETDELKKEARRLDYKATKALKNVDYNRLEIIEKALKDLDSYKVNSFDLYKRLSGEVEARNTEARSEMSEEERIEKSPASTEDVPRSEQLVVFDDGTESYLESSEENNQNADAMKNVKGYYIPAEKIIVLLKNADASTIAHEWAHWYLDLLQNNSDNEIIAEKLEAVRKLVKNEGEEFTEEQHEKFARAFEVYLRSGYAKNNKLKQVFEDFKNFLWSIYDSVMNIVYKENGVDKTFTDEEIKNIKDIFDNLLTTERERIKSTVFDKIEEIDNKIEEIKNHEAEEFKELDSIWRDNIALMDRKSDKKRKVKEYIELAEKMTSRDTKEVREWKKRYKDATLDILAAVSGKSRSWVANSRNWEKLQDIIGGAGDEITTSGGFRAEWSEFYADTGVSYENDEIDGDYKLAEQAFSVMTDGNYDRVYGENYEFADIDRYVSKLDYLAAKVKTLKGTEKEAAFEAFCEVFGNMPEMPEEIAAEIAQKIPEMEEVYETQQRDDFNKKVYPSIPVVQQLQWYITNKLNELKVYNPETRYKMRLNRSHRLYRYIKNINSVDAAKKQIRRINEYVIDDMRNNQRSLLSKEIQKQIKVNSKVVKVGSLTKGKFDWKTNTVFAELVQLNKLSREEAEKQLGAMVNIDNAANSEARDSFDEADSGEFNKTGDFQAVLRNEFLQYRSQKLQDLDVTHTIQLLQDILELKEKGRKAKSEEDFLNKTQRWNTKNNLLDVLEETKLSGAQFGANWIAGVGRVAGLNGGVLANWESLLNAIFNRETAQKYSLLGDEARSEVYARRHMLHFYKKASDIYGFKSPSNWDKFIDFDYLQPIIDLMREYDNEKYTYTQKVFSINTPSGYAESSIEISRAQMITMFAWSLNDELEQRLFNQFGVQQIMDMFEGKLSKEDKELAWALVDTCETMREDINEVFIRTTGLSLPKVQNYFPSKAERVQSDIDLYHDFFVKSSNPSFIKERKSCHRIPMKPMAPLEILIPHINKTAKYVILSEKTNFMNQVFKDTAIKTKMQEIWGSDNGAKIYQTLINKLAACTFTNYAKGTNLVASALDTVSRNYISSRIGFSGKVALGQLLSVVNYAENMPAAAWAKGFKETIKHPVESFNYMLENCEYLQSRLAGNTQNEIISILTSEKDRFRKLRNFMSTNTKWGDIIAITLGGKPYVDYLMEQGMTKEEAFDKFLEDTLRAQQAGTTSSISEWQSAQAQNCLTRMIFAFQNTTIQYERKFIDTLIQAKKGELSKSEAAKKLFIYKILNPIMFTSFLGNLSLLALFRGLAGGDDDEPAGFLKSVIESIFLSGFGAYGFAGFFSSAVVESIIANLDSGYKHFDKAIPIYSDFNREIQKWVKGDLEFADYVEALAFASDYGAGVAGTKVINAAGGLGNIAQGQFGVGLTRMAGWGEYTSTKAWTGEEPERKKKKRK